MPLTAPVVPPRFRLLVRDEVDSTNAEALRLAAAGDTGPLWLFARNQTAGRGRSGRSWQSVRGNLYASLLDTIECPLSSIQQVSLVAGVAVVDAVRAAAGGPQAPLRGLRLKWPNDVLIDGCKFAGILPESAAAPGGDQRPMQVVVIGVGINLAGHPDDLPRKVTHLAAHGVSIGPEAMLHHLAYAFDEWLRRWDDGRGFHTVREAWLERAGPAGEIISVNTGKRQLQGYFAGIDSDGALLVRDELGQELRFTYGDVALSGEAQAAASQG
jgi:BirA family biotin operon repressor/biotin-[acetyl-CoA-carboxylase] ligase